MWICSARPRIVRRREEPCRHQFPPRFRAYMSSSRRLTCDVRYTSEARERLEGVFCRVVHRFALGYLAHLRHIGSARRYYNMALRLRRFLLLTTRNTSHWAIFRLLVSRSSLRRFRRHGNIYFCRGSSISLAICLSQIRRYETSKGAESGDSFFDVEQRFRLSVFSVFIKK